tara:strand:- start:574 stop:747 length:174 start_codon:yes stop_codon:yes gene_type:complete
MTWIAEIIRGILAALLPFLARENPTKGKKADRAADADRSWIRAKLRKRKRDPGPVDR